MADELEIAQFLEASQAVVRGPYDLSLVEGSITTPQDAERIQRVRRVSKHLVTIGACATAGGIQALRNFQDVKEFTAAVYARPEYIRTLERSTPISAHVPVDFELNGCPNKQGPIAGGDRRLPRNRRRPQIRSHSVCVEGVQAAGARCVMVAQGFPAWAVTHARLRRPSVPPTGAAATAASGRWVTPGTWSLGLLVEA